MKISAKDYVKSLDQMNPEQVINHTVIYLHQEWMVFETAIPRTVNEMRIFILEDVADFGDQIMKYPVVYDSDLVNKHLVKSTFKEFLEQFND